VLLGSALAAGVAAFPANATTFTDTSVSASNVVAETFSGANLMATNDTGKTFINLSGTNVTWTLHGTVPTGVARNGNTITYTGSAVTNPPTQEIVANATDSQGNIEALEITVVLGANSIQIPTGTSPQVVPVTVTALAATNNANNVTFSAVSSESNTINFAETGLPTGLTSGNPTLTFSGGTAAPGTYPGVKFSGTDTDGAVQNGTFTLTVTANAVVTSNYGDYVNKFGNGFDAFRQHAFAGAIVAGWPATQHDPATHFIQVAGSHTGAIQLEYAPNGTAIGLCVSDPGGGWASDPLPDGLILTGCNSGPWQQFVPQSDGTLRNLATGLIVDPNGKGGQLRGGSAPVSWGGSSYTFTAFSSLPA
jgi:hypothetical protein